MAIFMLHSFDSCIVFHSTDVVSAYSSSGQGSIIKKKKHGSGYPDLIFLGTPVSAYPYLLSNAFSDLKLVYLFL